MKKALILICVLVLWTMSLLAGEFLMNDSGGPATVLRVTFSEPVTLIDFGDILMDVTPSGESAEFTFSGGEVESWGTHRLNWEPASGSLLAVEWLGELIVPAEFNPEEATVVPHTRQDKFQLVLPEDDGGEAVGVITRTLSVEQIPFVVTYEFESDLIDGAVEWASTHEATSSTQQVSVGPSARFLYLGNRVDPVVTARVLVDGQLYEWQDPDISFPLHNETAIGLDARQFFPDSTIHSAEWSTSNGDPEDAVTFPISTNLPGGGTLVSQWPNALQLTCRVQLVTGELVERACHALIYFQDGCPFPIRGTATSFGPPMREATWARHLDAMIPLLQRLGMNTVLFPIQWYYGYPDADGVFNIEPVYHEPYREFSIGDDPRGATPPDEIVEYVFERLVEAQLPPLVVLQPLPNQNQPEIQDLYNSSGYGQMLGFMHSDGFLCGNGMGYFNFLTHYVDMLTDLGVIGVGFGAEQGALVSHGGEESRDFFADAASYWRAEGYGGLLTFGTLYINRMDVCEGTYCREPIDSDNYDKLRCGIPWQDLDAIGLTFYPSVALTNQDTTAQMLGEARRIISRDLTPLAELWERPLFILDTIAMEVDGGAVYPVLHAEECGSTECIRNSYEEYDPEEHRRYVTALLRAFSEANLGGDTPLFRGIMIDSYSSFPYWSWMSEEDRMYREMHAYLDADCAEPAHHDTLQVFFREEPLVRALSPETTHSVLTSIGALDAQMHDLSSASTDVEQTIDRLFGSLELGVRMEDVVGKLGLASLPVLMAWGDVSHFDFWLQGPTSSERQATVDDRFNDTGWKVSALRGAAVEEGIAFSVEFAADDRPSFDQAVEYVIQLGSSVMLFIRSGQPVASIVKVVQGTEVEKLIPFEYFSLDTDSIDIAVPRELLDEIGVVLEELEGQMVRLQVTYRAGEMHAFIYCPGETPLPLEK